MLSNSTRNYWGVIVASSQSNLIVALYVHEQECSSLTKMNLKIYDNIGIRICDYRRKLKIWIRLRLTAAYLII